jgi:hypothetical protein
VPGLAARYGGLAYLVEAGRTGALWGGHRAPAGGGGAAHGVSLVPFNPCGLHLRDKH